MLASATLASEVKKKVRESGLVVWLDAEKRYSGLVGALQRGDHAFPYPVVSFGGSYLELMLALEPYGSGLDRDHVLIHLPGLNKDTVKETPVFELYEAGTVFEKALPTVVREAAVGVARPEEVDGFLRGSATTLESADAWLDGLRSGPRDRVTLLLDSLRVDDVVLSLIAEDGRFRDDIAKDADEILAYLERSLGLDRAWRAFRIGERDVSTTGMATLVSSWLMAVEFVHDLKVEPVMPELRRLTKLAPPLVKEARRLAVKSREAHPDIYEAFANELQDALEQERTSHHAGHLGSIDTFRFEEATMRGAALGDLLERRWDEAATKASARTTERCFWVRRAPALQRTWELVRLAAEAGQALVATRKTLDRCGSLDEIVERYVEKLAPVDRLHRTFEQRAHAVLASDLEDYERLLDVRRALRAAYRAWADGTNRAFFELCRSQGPLPSRSLRQRTVFDEEVKPLVAQGARVAYILVDALRFEMAQGLAVELERERLLTSVHGRLAELPTDTIVGMNALAPVERNGRMKLVQKDGAPAGFSTGEFTVAHPPDRIKAISLGVLAGVAADIVLEDFAELDVTALKKRMGGKPLVIVRSLQLDTAGENSLHLGTFEHTLGLLRNAIALLSRAGIERFVVTSDHGFLLQDASVEGVPLGANRRVAQRRYALLAAPSGMPDVLELPFSALEYDVEQEGYLVFRADTAPWKVSETIAPFVHGGNSLQERVIPVMRLQRQGAPGKFLTRYEVVARPEPAHLGRQRLRVAIRLQDRENATLGFVAPRSLGLALRVKSEGAPRTDVTLVILDATPPASLIDGQVLVPPNREEAVIEFELEGMHDEKVRVEVFHPGGREEVASKVVEGFFDVARNRRLGATDPPPPSVRAQPRGDDPAWADLIDDPGYRKVFELLAVHQVVNESELGELLGSPRRVRAFARHFDDLLPRIPFEVEILTVSGLKAYKRRG